MATRTSASGWGLLGSVVKRIGIACANSLAATALLLAALLAGCGSLGPQTMRVERTAYNRAITETQEEELLLNLVRARYLRGIAFLQVTSISSTVGVEAGIGGSVGSVEATGSVVGVGSLGFSDRPTVIYQPVTGELFVRQLLTPLSIESLALLIDGGFDTADVFRVFVSSLNGLQNARSAATATPDAPPENARFREAMNHFQTLIDRGHVYTGIVAGGAPSLILRIAPEGKASPEGRAFLNSLRLDPRRLDYRLIVGEGEGGGDSLIVTTRSVAAAMQFLSKGVQVPDGDLLLVGGGGQQTLWKPLMSGLFEVRETGSRPADA